MRFGLGMNRAGFRTHTGRKLAPGRIETNRWERNSLRPRGRARSIILSRRRYLLLFARLSGKKPGIWNFLSFLGLGHRATTP